MRVATAAFRKHPRIIGCAVLLAVATSLTGMFLILRRQWLTTGASDPGTVLIAFAPSTIDAIRDGRIGGDLAGLSVHDRKSWRMLYGRLMEKLAEASPRTVVWDYHFPDCQPEYDPSFLRGLEALNLTGAPVVVGCRNFDVNGEPLGCEHILSAAHAVGALRVGHPATDPGQFLVPICFRRGLAPLVPGLATAGFAAARFPDCELHLRSEGERVLAGYRRKRFTAHQPAWRAEIDEFPVVTRKRMEDRFFGLGKSEGEWLLTRVGGTETEEWSSRTVPFEAVLLASRDRLRSWFAGRAVIVGQMLPGEDEHPTGLGTKIHGCLVHAQALDAFLTQVSQPALSNRGVIIRTLLYCLLGGLIARAAPLIPPQRYRLSMIVCLGAGFFGTIGFAAAGSVHSRWPAECSIVVSAVLVAGCVIYLCRVMHSRQTRIGGGPVWPSPGRTSRTRFTGDKE